MHTSSRLRLALNIGMRTNGRRVAAHNISAARIVCKLACAGFTVRNMEIFHAPCEDTCSLVVEQWAESYDLVALSTALDQDCIAVVPMERMLKMSLSTHDTHVWVYDWTKGALIGPNSAAWGAFDRALFKVCPQ